MSRTRKYSLAEMNALLAEAGRESLEFIEEDIGRASRKIQPHLKVIQARLFDPDFEVGNLLEIRGVDSSLTVDFHREMGISLGEYLDTERLTTGARLLTRCGLGLDDIAFLVGFSNRKVFSNAFQRHTGLRPTPFRWQWKAVVEKVGPPEIEVYSSRLLRDLRTGNLDPVRARQLLDFFERMLEQNELEKTGRDSASSDSASSDSASRDSSARRLAEEELRRIDDQDPDQRFIWVRDILRFNRPAFFFLLSEKIDDEIGSGVTRENIARENIDRALSWAQLAMVHVEANAEELGEEATGPLRRQALDALAAVRQRARTLQPPLLDDRFWLEGKSVLWMALLEGRLRLGLGEHDAADRLFRRARSEAMGRGWLMEAAQGALGLASVLTVAASPGSHIASPEVADLVSQVIPALQDLADRPEAQSLRRDLSDALCRGPLTPELLRASRVRLERLAPPARLRFRGVKVNRDGS